MKISERPEYTESFCMKNHPEEATASLSKPASNESITGNWWSGHGDGCTTQTQRKGTLRGKVIICRQWH